MPARTFPLRAADPVDVASVPERTIVTPAQDHRPRASVIDLMLEDIRTATLEGLCKDSVKGPGMVRNSDK